MKKINILIVLCSLILFAQNSNISVSRSYIVFQDSNSSMSADIEVTNNSNDDINISQLAIEGLHASDFSIINDSCSNVVLSANDNCNIQVAFTPQNHGVKSAMLHIPYLSTSMDIFLTNYEDIPHNVKRRLAPVIYDVNISEELNASTTYSFNWSLIGYHNGYRSMVVMFDCTNIPEGECGTSYTSSEKFLESPLIPYDKKIPINWSYRGERGYKFQYSYNATIPDTRADGSDWSSTGTNVVVRFYVISNEDDVNLKSSLSVIIPGGISPRYYDTSGRKIEKTVCPSGGCI